MALSTLLAQSVAGVLAGLVPRLVSSRDGPWIEALVGSLAALAVSVLSLAGIRRFQGSSGRWPGRPGRPGRVREGARTGGVPQAAGANQALDFAASGSPSAAAPKRPARPFGGPWFLGLLLVFAARGWLSARAGGPDQAPPGPPQGQATQAAGAGQAEAIGPALPPGRPVLGRLERRSGSWRLVLTDGPRWPWALQFSLWTPTPGEALALLGPGRQLAFADGPNSPRDGLLGLVELEADEFLRLDPGRVSGSGGLLTWIESLRERLLGRLRDSGAWTATGLAPALLLGDRSALAADTSDLFRRTGTAHLLALSGLHVGLLFAGLLWPLSNWLAGRLPAHHQRTRSLLPVLLGSVGLVAFSALSGAAAPVQRASLCCALALGAKVGKTPRRVDSSTLFGAALLFELARDPRAQFEASAALSYASTAGLLWLTQPLERWFKTWLPSRGPALEPRSSRAAYQRALAVRAKRLLLTTFAATGAAQLATLPWNFELFGEFAWSSGPATFLAVLLLGLWLPLLWLAALSAQPAFGALCRLLESASLELLAAFDRLPGTPWALPEKPLGLVLGFLLLAIVAIVWGPVWARRSTWIAAALLLLPASSAPRGLEAFALDVGHGTAVCLRLPGVPALIFDAGTRDSPGLARRALLPLLRRWDPGRLQLVASHLDRDHIACLPYLAERFAPTHLAGAPALGPRIPRIDLDTGRLPLYDLGCPWPIELIRAGSGDQNEGSRSLVIRHPAGALVLFGDAVAEGLAGLLARGLLPEAPALVLAPHHGSDGPAVLEWLDRSKPKEVWISGRNGAPLEAELDRRGLCWRSTGREGWLALSDSYGSGLATWSARRPRVQRRQPPRRGRSPGSHQPTNPCRSPEP